MHADDFDAAMDRLDELMYGGEPSEPYCFGCFDSRPAGVPCPDCAPSPRERRRARHREWQARDRASRADRSPPSDVIRVPRPF